MQQFSRIDYILKIFGGNIYEIILKKLSWK